MEPLSSQRVQQLIDQYGTNFLLAYHDCDKAGTDYVYSRSWYRIYGRICVGVLACAMVGCIPILYRCHAREHRVWRLRHPEFSTKLWRYGIGLMMGSMAGGVLVQSPIGFGARLREAELVMQEYDNIAWDAMLWYHRLQQYPHGDEDIQKLVKGWEERTKEEEEKKAEKQKRKMQLEAEGEQEKVRDAETEEERQEILRKQLYKTEALEESERSKQAEEGGEGGLTKKELQELRDSTKKEFHVEDLLIAVKGEEVIKAKYEDILRRMRKFDFVSL